MSHPIVFIVEMWWFFCTGKMCFARWADKDAAREAHHCRGETAGNEGGIKLKEKEVHLDMLYDTLDFVPC